MWSAGVLIVHTILDWILYTIVDSFVKTAINNARFETYLIIRVKLSMVIDGECLNAHMIVKFLIRHGVFVEKIEIERFDHSI